MPEARLEGGSSAEADPQVKTWERFLKTYYKTRVNEAVLRDWPERKSIAVDYWDLHKFDHDLADRLLADPIQTIRRGEDALGLVDVPELMGTRPRLHLRVARLPDEATFDVRDLRAEHIGRLVAVSGLVKKVTEVRPKIQDAVFECLRCHAFLREAQEEHLVLKEPVECYEDQGGCGRASNFKLITMETRGHASKFVDTQKIEIQEAPERMRGGEQPQRLVVFVEDDLCGLVAPGDRIVVNGVLRSSVRKQNGVKSTIFDIHLDTVAVEMETKEFDEVEITPEEEEEIRRFSRDPQVYEKMRDSIAPTLYGMSTEKLTLLMQLFGGIEKHLPDGTRLRGDIHVLLVGDPGVAKSQLIRYMAKLAPRGIYTSGKSSSGAGLTAAAVKDEFGDGRWTLEAGAMVLADRGLLCVDEIDKMDKNDQSSMHEGMEQQSISVAKAGITAQLQSRCSVLGAANPKYGRFEEFSPLPEQIDFPPALLSRFDVIFTLLDKPAVERDTALATHILDVHRGGAMRMSMQAHPGASPYQKSDVDRALRRVEPPLAKDFIRKYVAFAKRSAFPVLTEAAKERLRDYYVNLRRQAQGEDGGPVPLTARQLEALVRLSEASARLRLSDEVTVEDTDRAVRIVEYYLKKISGSEGGIMDVDLVASGVSHTQRNAIGTLLEIIRELAAGTAEGAAKESVLAEAERRGIPRDKAEVTLDRLRQQSQVFSPRADHYRVVRER